MTLRYCGDCRANKAGDHPLHLPDGVLEGQVGLELDAPAPASEDAPAPELNPWALATAARDEAIAAVDTAADPDWKEAALEAVRVTARSLPEFIGDDVWATGLKRPREARALGPVFMRAKRRGWIEKTDRARPSVNSHLGPVTVWRSLIFTPKGW